MRHERANCTNKLERRVALRTWLRRTLFQGCSALGVGVALALTASAQVPGQPQTRQLPVPVQQTIQANPAYPQTLPSTGTAQAASASRLQAYNVPSSLVGQLGAQLQIHYHSIPEVKVTTDPKTGQLLILAPDAIHREIGAQIDGLMRANNIPAGDRGMQVASNRSRSYALQHLNWRELEDAVQRLAGPRLSVTTERNGELAILKIRNTSGLEDIVQVDRRANQVTLLGSDLSVAGWSQVITSLDRGQADSQNATHIVPVAPAEPRTVREAIRLVNATMQDPIIGEQDQAEVQLDDEEQVAAVDSLENLSSESGLFGDVQIEFVDDLGLVIIRGNKRDVQRTLEVIERIKDQAQATQPEVEVFELQHANAEAVATLVTQLYAQIFEPRQGAVSITALGQPNALLLIGRKEVVASVKELINKIDQPLDAANQLKVIRLLHASAVDVEARIREFFVSSPGGGTDVRPGLGTRVKVLADYRTNSLIIQASPREMEEVQKLIDKLDVEGTDAENEVRIFRLKNTLAEDLQTVIEEVITGQAQGGGQGGGQANASQATPLSGKITISTIDDGRKIESGLLAGVVVTADPSVNALVVRAPAESMDLIEQLINQLDQLPSAEARIKVFQLRNGDATSLAQTLQGLFGLAVTAGQGASNAFLNNLARSNLTTGGESSLVQLQIAPDPRTNSIVVSGAASDLEVFEVLLLRLDEDVVDNRRSEVIWLRNAGAAEVATALQTYFQQQAQIYTQLNATSQVLSTTQLLNRQVFVVPEGVTNSILISAADPLFQTAIDLIERLDRRPPLVSVQVVIAEVQLDDNFELGAEWGLQDGLLFDRGSATGGTLASPVFAIGNTLTGPSGNTGQTQNVAGQSLTSFGVGRSSATETGVGGLVLSASSEAVGVLLRALQTSNRVQILNRPQITTLDSRQATTLVGARVPRVTSVSQATAANPQQIQTTDEDVGLTLSILPRVNQDGLIVMDVYVENSSVGDPNSGIPIGFGQNGEVIRSPIISTTQADTTVTAYSGQTVVFAGLISKTRTSNRSQVPILGSLPIIGAAFRFDSESEQRRELLVVMTPRIIQTDEDYEMLKQVESSRMSWCLADVLNIHGDVGLSGGNGLWGPAKSPVIYPDVQPTVIEDRTRSHGPGGQGGGAIQPLIIDGGYPLGQDNPMIEQSLAPELESSAARQPGSSPFRTVSFPQQPQQPVSIPPQPAVNR